MDGAGGRGCRAAPDERYGPHYFATALGPVPYDRTQPEWLRFFGTIADRIVAEIRPRRVLDVGCAKGFLVEALRDRGVEAFGIDVSRYAIGEVRDDVKPFCRVASVLDPLEGPYDLITCIEVLEHLDEADGARAIAHICAAAPTSCSRRHRTTSTSRRTSTSGRAPGGSTGSPSGAPRCAPGTTPASSRRTPCGSGLERARRRRWTRCSPSGRGSSRRPRPSARGSPPRTPNARG
jgi:SAM-dependent methyltransferase